MIIDIERSKKEWLKEFNKRFSRFCANAPFQIGFDSSSGNTVTLYVTPLQGEKFSYDKPIDISKSVADTIYEISQDLSDYYPTFRVQSVSYEELTNKEITDYIIKGYSFEDAVEYKKEKVSEFNYVIQKVLNDQNALQLYHVDFDETLIVYTHMPVLIFLSTVQRHPVVGLEWFNKSIEVIKKKEK